MRRWFQRAVLTRRWATFLALGLSFAVFGVGSLNLFYLLRANLTLVAENGWMALADGAARQFVELVVTGYASMAGYVVFKACEHRLVHWLGDEPATADETAPGNAAPHSSPSASADRDH